MLYDPKWEKQTRADPLTLSGLIAWLETQDPIQSYDYACKDGSCLLDRYISSVTGKPSHPAQETHWKTCGGGDNYWKIAAMFPWTFGGALERARKIAGLR